MGSQFGNRLKSMQKTWDTNRDPQPNVPAGKYTMQLQNAELSENSNGKLQIHTENLVIDGEYSGEVAHDFLQLENEIGMQFTARWIEAMGYDVPDDMTEIEEIIASIAEAAPTFLGRVKVSKGFTNVQVTEILDPGEASESEDDAEEDEDETEEEDEEEETEEEDEEEEDDDELGELIAFAQSQDLEVDDDDDADSVTEKILEFEWDKKELTDEEIALLESIDAKFVKGKKAKPKPKKKSKKKSKKKPKKKGKK